ncbi:MAG: hypothetical protein J5927_03450 [Oscillospiraceae bacterium]|nr:hypothetical protein [Oscillospiraceae bacterium]
MSDLNSLCYILLLAALALGGWGNLTGLRLLPAPEERVRLETVTYAELPAASAASVQDAAYEIVDE